MPTSSLEYNWTNVGTEWIGDKYIPPSERQKPMWTRSQILEAIETTIIWYDVPQDGSAIKLPMMPGLNINAIIEQCNIPHVSRVGHGNGLAPYGLLAIVGNYKNGRATIYALDAGDVCTILLSVFEPKES